MAASVALMQSQVSALQQANEAMHERRKKKKRKVLQSDKALSVAEVVVIAEQEQIEAQMIDEMPRPKKRLLICSGCRQQGHTIRTCVKKV